MAFLPLVLLRIDVELLAPFDGRAFDRLPRGAVDAPKITSTLSCSTSFAALASDTLSVVALSSRCRSTCRPSRPPFALMSLMSILATFALAVPITESGPVWSVTTPTLIDESFIALSPLKTDG